MSNYLSENHLIIEFKSRNSFILDKENLNNYESKKRAESIKNDIESHFKSKSNTNIIKDIIFKNHHIKEILSKCSNFINFYENLIIINKNEQTNCTNSIEKSFEEFKRKYIYLEKILNFFLINSEHCIQKIKDLIELYESHKTLKSPEKIIFHYISTEKDNLKELIDKWENLKLNYKKS